MTTIIRFRNTTRSARSSSNPEDPGRSGPPDSDPDVVIPGPWFEELALHADFSDASSRPDGLPPAA